MKGSFHQNLTDRLIYPLNTGDWPAELREAGVLLGRIVAARINGNGQVIVTIESYGGMLQDGINLTGKALAEQDAFMIAQNEFVVRPGAKASNKRRIISDLTGGKVSIVVIDHFGQPVAEA